MRTIVIVLLLSVASSLFDPEIAEGTPPPIQPSYCGATMCVLADAVPSGGRLISATFVGDGSHGLGKIVISYENLRTVMLSLEEADLQHCNQPMAQAPGEDSAHYSYTRLVSIPTPMRPYLGPLCRRLTVSIEGSTADAARQMERSIYTIWLLAGRDLHFVDKRNILTPFDARVELAR